MDKVNIRRALDQVSEHWAQRVIGEANGQVFKVARGVGETRWHRHDDQDELFMVVKGHLTIQLRGRDIELYEDDLFVVPKGVEHCPKAEDEAEFVIVGLNVTSTAAGGKPNV